MLDWYERLGRRVERTFDNIDGLHKFISFIPTITDCTMPPSEEFNAAASYLSSASPPSQVSAAIRLEVLGRLLHLTKSSDF